MPPNDTLSHRPRLRFWGWGNADEQLTPAEEARLLEIAKGVSREGFTPTTPPRAEEFSFAEAQVRVPDSLAPIISTTPYDRLTHAYGKSWADGARMCLRQLPPQPLLVAFPRDEQQISDVLEWAEREQLAVIPFGGGTSVCGGMEAVGADDSRAVVSLDLQYLNRVLEIDHASRAARIQGGALGRSSRQNCARTASRCAIFRRVFSSPRWVAGLPRAVAATMRPSTRTSTISSRTRGC